MDSAIKDFSTRTILPHFPLPSGNLVWHGDSTLDNDAIVYYFSIDHIDYILVQETVAGLGRDKLRGNAIAPHETTVAIHPMNTTYSDIYIETKGPRDATAGYYSLFRIERV